MLKFTYKFITLIDKICKYTLLSLIYFYKKFISKYLPPSCRYYPSCSDYSILAFKKYNTIKAVSLSVSRVLRCNQLFKGGIDYP